MPTSILSSAAGRARLDQRIGAAVRAVCGRAAPTDLNGLARSRRAATRPSLTRPPSIAAARCSSPWPAPPPSSSSPARAVGPSSPTAQSRAALPPRAPPSPFRRLVEREARLRRSPMTVRGNRDTVLRKQGEAAHASWPLLAAVSSPARRRRKSSARNSPHGRAGFADHVLGRGAGRKPARLCQRHRPRSRRRERAAGLGRALRRYRRPDPLGPPQDRGAVAPGPPSRARGRGHDARLPGRAAGPGAHGLRGHDDRLSRIFRHADAAESPRPLDHAGRRAGRSGLAGRDRGPAAAPRACALWQAEQR